jgi:hypothetical protein
MPGRDGSGPLGQGPMTGRGLGVCTGVNAPMYGGWFGRGFGRGFGRCFGRGFGFGLGRRFGFGAYNPNFNYNQLNSKEDLQAQKEYLSNMIKAIA